MLGRATPGLARIAFSQWKKYVLESNNDVLRPAQLQMAPFSVRSTQLQRFPRDRGPERNYRKKMKKKATEEMKKLMIDSEKMMAEMKKLEVKKQEDFKMESSRELKGILSGIKIHVPSDADVRRRLGMPIKSVAQPDRIAPRLKGRDNRTRVDFMNPEAGKRLGIFDHPQPRTAVMPPHKPSLAEEDEAKSLEMFLMLRPNNQFEALMKDTQFSQRFPIDNEDAIETEEKNVGFEDHVLLDHLLKEFPAKGPVRHFMELVVTGLSKNAFYTAEEKKECVEWYKNYFSQFTPEELQAMETAKIEPIAEAQQ